jgi:thiol-disulfide isomerase/thioredoxin
MKNKFLLGIGLILSLTLFSGFAVAQKAANAQETVSLQSLDGKTLAAGDLKGRVTVLAIGATWLPLSRQQAEIVGALQQNYGRKNVAIYFISTDSADEKSKNYANDAKIKTFAERNKITSAVLRDATGGTLRLYNLDQIPAFVVLDKEGKVSATITGLDAENANDESVARISAAIDKIL